MLSYVTQSIMAEYPFSEHRHLVGRVRVPLSSITFQNEVQPRPIDTPIVEKLIKIFTTSSGGCERDKLENHISAIITTVELDAVLQSLGFTRDNLYKSLLDGVYPTLISSSKIYCINGRHWIEAAEQFFINSS